MESNRRFEQYLTISTQGEISERHSVNQEQELPEVPENKEITLIDNTDHNTEEVIEDNYWNYSVGHLDYP